MEYNSFPQEVCDRLKAYVYRLVDPRNGETFYVGKGTGNRGFEHARAERGFMGKPSDKIAHIRKIRLAGQEPLLIIHRHGLTDEQAFEVEAALLDAYRTDNLASGKGHDRGAANAGQIIRRYSAEPATFKHRVVIINIARSLKKAKRSIYDSVRYCWKISQRKASLIQVVLAVGGGGVIMDAFIPRKWFPAVKMREFPEHRQRRGRIGFVGHRAPKEILDLYKGKRVPDAYRPRGAANPIRYAGSGWTRHRRGGSPTS